MSQSKVKTRPPGPPPRRVSSFETNSGSAKKVSGSVKTNQTASKSTVSSKSSTSKKTALVKASDNDKPSKPKYDEEMEKRLDNMLEGDMSDLPPLPRSVVRIFISSTFSDMRAERNALSHIVAPTLQKVCASLDLDFQLVDLRWGLTEDVQNDHSAEKLCLQEVENCQEVSLGPNFICILGNRYGSRPARPEILWSEFEMLRDQALSLGLDVNILDMWYKKDENQIPPAYILQPIRLKFSSFGDMTPGNEELRQRDTKSWQETSASLLSVLRKAASDLHARGKLTEDQKHMYFKSVTEYEIAKGIFEVSKPKSHCMLYRRKLTGFSQENTEDNEAQRFMNITTEQGKKSLDGEANQLQQESISKISKKLGSSNTTHFELPWKNGGIDIVTYPEHQSYIEKFAKKLTTDVVNMIQTAKEERSSYIRQQEYYSEFDETLHHLRFCQMKCQSFCGQTDILKSVKKYIQTSATQQPLIISAESGAGKTSIMAMIMQSLKSWIKESHIGVIRFLGTSPETLNIYNVLFSVCGQLADCTNLIMEPMGYRNMESFSIYMPRFLRTVSSAFKGPIVILLDSIDQLSGEYDCYNMSWLPTRLPENIRLILSTLPREHNILGNIKKRLPGSTNFLEVPLLQESTAKQITDKYLQLKERKVTDSQLKVILETFSKAPSPLYLRLLLDEALLWSSFTPVSELQLASSIRAAINVLFDRLEKKFGEVVVRNALGYITVGLNGISEIELEDVLSCDDEVLNDVYRFHDPPVPGFIRIPPVLWARVRYDIREYLVDRMSQGKTTMFWYHRQFKEAASDRYVQGKAEQKLHKMMLQLYLAEVGIRKDIYLSRRKKQLISVNRQVTPQPLTSRNLRALMCACHHLKAGTQSVEDEISKGQVLCNFRFLSAKIAACSTEEVIKNMAVFLKQTQDEEIRIMKEFLELNSNNLKNPSVLAGSILAYMRPNEDSVYLKKLQKDAQDFMSESQKTLLIPVFPCLAVRGTEKDCSLLDQADVRCVDVDGETLITGGAGFVKLWSIKSGNLLKSVEISVVPDEISVLGPSGRLVLQDKEQKVAKVLDLNSGLFVFDDIIPSGVLAWTLSVDRNTLYLVTQESKMLLHELDLISGSIKKVLTIQKMFQFVNLKCILSSSERYLVIQAKCTQEDYQGIKDSWKKAGGFGAQPHPYRFAAVDLTQNTGNLLLCLRQMSKIPTLGETVAPYRGNTMLIATRRHGIFWDIPTGKCDQHMSKGKKLVMIYRPDYTGGEKCQGANTCFVHPPTRDFIAVGSEDGYVMMYNFESGLPVGMKAPPTRHCSQVRFVAVTSNALTVASVCEEGVIKLWNPQTGLEMFSMRLGGQSKHLSFTQDSSHLVALLHTKEGSRVAVFKVKLALNKS